MRGLPAARFPAYWHGRYGAAQTPAVVRHVDARRRASPTSLGVAPPAEGRRRPSSTTVDQEFSSSFSVSCCCLIERQAHGSGTAAGGTFVELADTLIAAFDLID